MRLFNANPDNISNRIQQAGQSLLGKIYEYKKLPKFEDAISDALSIMLLESRGEKIEERNIDMRIRYSVMKEALEFSEKARLKYGITDPVETVLIWMSIIKGYSIKRILSVDAEVNNMAGTDRDHKKRKIDKFLDTPDESLQIMMGNLPIVNCAVAAANAEIDKDIMTNVSNVLSGKIGAPGNKKCKHYILLDGSVSMRDQIMNSKVRKISYISAIISELTKDDYQNETVINFHDESTITDSITIKNELDKRRFWMSFGMEEFDYPKTSGRSLWFIRETIRSKDYRQAKESGMEIHINIVTDRYYNKFHPKEMEDLARALDSEDVKINLFMLEALDDIRISDKVSLMRSISTIKKRDLFIPDSYGLVNCTERMESWFK